MEQVKFYSTSDIDGLKNELKKRNLLSKGTSRTDLVERLKLDDMEKRKELGMVEIYARTSSNLHKTIFITKDKCGEELVKSVVDAFGFVNRKIALYWRTLDEPNVADHVVNDYTGRKVWRKFGDGERVGSIFGVNGLPLLVLVDGE
jgi:hypothetical protein